MVRTIRVQLGRSPKNLFTETFDTEDSSAASEVMKRYLEFFCEYKRTHSISSRRWNYPIVWFKDNNGEFYEKYKVSPNGSWEEINTRAV